jgi:hypothetical protein
MPRPCSWIACDPVNSARCENLFNDGSECVIQSRAISRGLSCDYVSDPTAVGMLQNRTEMPCVSRAAACYSKLPLK